MDIGWNSLSNTFWNNLIDSVLTFYSCEPVELFVNLPLVEQVTDWHQPGLLLGPMEERYTIKNQSGKQLFVAYPTCAFFEGSSSLSTFRFVPLYMASMMAFL